MLTKGNIFGRCVKFAPHDLKMSGNVNISRSSIDHFERCICHYLVLFRQDHVLDPPNGSHQLPVL